jgi:hypothetical protein
VAASLAATMALGSLVVWREVGMSTRPLFTSAELFVSLKLHPNDPLNSPDQPPK